MKNYQLSREMTKKIDKEEHFEKKGEISASVVVVTYQIEKSDLEKTFKALDCQTRDDFEVIVIDNGNQWDVLKEAANSRQVSRYIKLKKNYGLNPARNIGARRAKGEVLIFLDDDGVPAEDFIEGHLKIYKNEKVVAARGKVLPKNEGSILNKITRHYDLGKKPFPYYINTEGNSSIKRELFLRLGGVSESLTGAGGHEGADLSYKISLELGREDGVYYNPWAVIYHDYSPNLTTYFRKQIRHKKHGRDLKEKRPKLFQFIEKFEEVDGKKKSLDLSFGEKVQLAVIKIVNKIILKFV